MKWFLKLVTIGALALLCAGPAFPQIAAGTGISAGTGQTQASIGAALYPVVGGETGAINLQYPYGNVLRYDTIQHAISSNVGGQIFFPAGNYTISTTLTLDPTGVRLTGSSRAGVNITYTGTGVAIDAYTNHPSNWAIEHLSITVSNDAGGGIKAGNSSQHQELDDVAIYGNTTATNTGTGLELNSGSPGSFSGNLSARLFYTLGFKYGIHAIGSSLGLNTWSSVTFIHCFILGRSAGIITGSRGIWFDALTNGVGSVFAGGAIEGYDTAVWMDTGGYGIDFSADLEGNNNNYGGGSVAGTLGSSFAGRVKVTSAAGPSYEQSANGTTNRWFQWQQINGQLDQETYYGPRTTVWDDSTASAEWGLYRGPTASSFISGTANPTKKFGVVMGIGSDNAGARNFLRLNGQTVHWDTQSPQTTGLGTWAVGDIAYNAAPGTAPSAGWVCTVAGSPGTWVSRDSLLLPIVTIPAPGSDIGSVLNVTGFSGSATSASIQGNAGPIFANYLGKPNFAMNSSGTDDGFIQNDAADTWSLAHGTSFGALGTFVLKWTKNGFVTINQPTAAGAALTLPAGSTTTEPLLLTSGTNLTSPVAGAVEYDGVVPYFTPTASSRGVVMTDAFEVLTAAYTLTSQTAAQKLLNGTSTGTITVPVGTFEFECQFSLSSVSATATVGFALGGTATFTQAWWATTDVPGALATPGTASMTYNTAANTAISAAAASGFEVSKISGIVRVTVAGTVIPQVSMTVAAAAVVGANSFCRFHPIGAQAVVSVGNWN
jgi:hypothetical protein